MSILEAIQEAHAATEIGIKNLHYANVQEFNSFIVEFKKLDYPANVVVPVIVSGDMIDKPRISQQITIQGWVLTRISEDTNNWRSIKLEEAYIGPMRHKAKLFLSALMDTEIVDPQATAAAFTIRPEYMFLSSHLFGVSYTLQLPTFSDVC